MVMKQRFVSTRKRRRTTELLKGTHKIEKIRLKADGWANHRAGADQATDKKRVNGRNQLTSGTRTNVRIHVIRTTRMRIIIDDATRMIVGFEVAPESRDEEAVPPHS